MLFPDISATRSTISCSQFLTAAFFHACLHPLCHAENRTPTSCAENALMPMGCIVWCGHCLMQTCNRNELTLIHASQQIAEPPRARKRCPPVASKILLKIVNTGIHTSRWHQEHGLCRFHQCVESLHGFLDRGAIAETMQYIQITTTSVQTTQASLYSTFNRLYFEPLINCTWLDRITRAFGLPS